MTRLEKLAIKRAIELIEETGDRITAITIDKEKHNLNQTLLSLHGKSRQPKYWLDAVLDQNNN